MKKLLTKDGRPFIIRRPGYEDAENIIRYSKDLFSSTDQVLTTPEEYTISVQDEEKWIDNFNSNPASLLLVAEMDGRIAGLLFFLANTKKKNMHSGEFGVNVHPDFQEIGIGRRLVEELLTWARESSQIEKVYLSVFETNERAIRLYASLGFKIEGRHINAIKQPTGGYVNTLQMYMLVNNFGMPFIVGCR